MIYGQQARCGIKGGDKKSSMYRVGRSICTVEEHPAFVLYISIKPGYFNREDMKLLARHLKDDFSAENRIAVYIFDYYPATKSFSYIKQDNPTYARDQAALRGFYFFDRNTNEESIAFSSERGKPFDEVKINLSGDSNAKK
jgi:hypothetical protein